MIYAPTQEHGKQVKIEDVPQEQRDRFSLTDAEVQELAKQAVQIEKHYGRPMDIEWAKDGTPASCLSCRRVRKPSALAVR
jgi:pyruvate,water dikinase